jgi:hypothetical protein
VQDAKRRVNGVRIRGLAYATAPQAGVEFSMEIATFQHPSAGKADAQIVLIRDPSGRNDIDVELKDRSCSGIREAAVATREYLQELGATSSKQDRHRADLDHYLMGNGAIR